MVTREILPVHRASVALSVMALLLASIQTIRADEKFVHSKDKFMGTGSCSSSNCHGSVNALTGSNVLQNEYHTWAKLDKHSQAYSVLLNEDSQRMAKLLGIPAAEKDPLCLKCHATYVPSPELQGPKYQLEDGVSCESCHNPSERWLQSHTARGATHEENIANGLADIVPLDKRAALCLSCHFGTDDKTVNHRLYGAGHPRLAFELDTFGVLQPKHWVVDADYVTRKASYVPLSAWLIGQLNHALATIEALESPKRSKNGWLPELSLFDCYSCHHSLTEDQWKNREYGGRPGELNLNLPSLYMLREALLVLDPSIAADLAKKVTALHSAYKADAGVTSTPSLKKLLVDRVMPLTSMDRFDSETCRRLAKQLANFGASSKWHKYELSEQIGMGLQAVFATSSELGLSYKQELDALFLSLKSSESFDPVAFSAAAGTLARKL